MVQEAFMRLHAQFDEVREPRKWLYRTVHNLALNHRRDNAKIVSLEQKRDGEENLPTPPKPPILNPCPMNKSPALKASASSASASKPSTSAAAN